MILIDENNKQYIGNKKSKKVFSLSESTIVDNNNCTEIKDNNFNFKSICEYNERIYRLFYILDSLDNGTPIMYIRIFSNKNDNIKFIVREQLVFKIESFDTFLNTLKGDIIAEIILLTNDVDIQSILSKCRESKLRIKLFHFNELEDNQVFINSKNITRLYIPKNINTLINKIQSEE